MEEAQPPAQPSDATPVPASAPSSMSAAAAPSADGAQPSGDVTPAPASTSAATTTSDDAAAPAPAPAAAPAAAPKKPTFSKRTKLAQAVRQGQAGRVRLLVEQDMARELKGQHPGAYIAMLRHYLGVAVAEGPDEGIIDYLLSKIPEGTRLNSIAAADRKDVESASYLMAAGDSMQGGKDFGHLLEWKACPIYMAICNGQEQRALRLLARADDLADLPLEQKEGDRLLLHEACSKGMLAVVKALVAPPHAVPIVENFLDEDGSTPFCLALQYNRPDVVHFLCQHLKQQYGGSELVRCIDFPMDPEHGDEPWSTAYTCLNYDALEALQILLLERPDSDGFFTSRSPNYSSDSSPVLMAARHASLRCLKWLVEEHGALRGSPTPPVLHLVCGGTIGQGNRLQALKYLVEDCGIDVDMLHEGETAAEVAKRRGRTELYDYLTRGKRAAAADEAADALLAELEAEAERKARKQQKKKGKKKGKAAGGEAKAGEQQQTVATAAATVEEAMAQAAALALGGGDEEQEDEAEVNPIEPQPVPASVVVEDRKIPAPKPQQQQAAPRIPESEEAHSSKPAPATTKSSLAPPPPPPSAAGGDCCSPAAKKPAAAAEEDPREAAFLLKHARREDICPLSGALLTDPVIASDGITYARAALEAYVAAAQAAGETLRSPVTGELIASVIFPNVAVKRLVEHYVEEQRAEWRRPGRRPRRR